MRYKILSVAFLISARLAAASAPTMEALENTLLNARAVWGVEFGDPIEFRIEPLNSCDLRRDTEIATIQTVTAVTTMRFDDDSAPVESLKVSYIIRFNSACDWSKLNLQAVMIHEYGHLVTSLPYHSENHRSIMYPIVKRDGSQVILPDDRAKLRTALAGATR